MVATEEGVVYTLRFGEVVFASGEELSAGVADDARKEEESSKPKAENKKPEGATENRYLMVTVLFDPSYIPEPKPDAPPVGPLTIPDDPFQPAPDDPKRVAAEKAEKEKADRQKADYEKKVADGKKRVGRADGPVRQLVLCHSGKQFPLDRAGSRRLATAQGEERTRVARRPGRGGNAQHPRSARAGHAGVEPSLIGRFARPWSCGAGVGYVN